MRDVWPSQNTVLTGGKIKIRLEKIQFFLVNKLFKIEKKDHGVRSGEIDFNECLMTVNSANKLVILKIIVASKNENLEIKMQNKDPQGGYTKTSSFTSRLGTS